VWGQEAHHSSLIICYGFLGWNNTWWCDPD
jgi:hypothetical protein